MGWVERLSRVSGLFLNASQLMHQRNVCVGVRVIMCCMLITLTISI